MYLTMYSTACTLPDEAALLHQRKHILACGIARLRQINVPTLSSLVQVLGLRSKQYCKSFMYFMYYKSFMYFMYFMYFLPGHLLGHHSLPQARPPGLHLRHCYSL